MFKLIRTEYLLVILSAVVLPLVALQPTAEQKARRRTNQPPTIRSFTPSSQTIEVCPWASAEPEVFLFVDAADADRDVLHYEYSTKDGSISGAGSSVLWNLLGVARGPHEVRVTVSDEKGSKAEASLTVTTVDSATCDHPPSPCPEIKVSCPADMDKLKPFTFAAIIKGEETAGTPPTFQWKINAGRIVKGQNSRELEVTTNGARGFDSITATLFVSGFDPSCVGTTVSCSTKILW